MKYTHVTPGKGQAINHVQLKNLRTGRQKELRLNTGSTIEPAYVEAKECQYLYRDASGHVFMDNESYDQFHLPENIVTDALHYVAEGDNVQVVYVEHEPMSIQLPAAVTMEVTEAEDAVKGDTVSNLQKSAKVSTGYALKVPAHIKVGDKIKINTETGEYMSRA
ncbi:MAG: elongation factor P [Planctomycetota bacterium]|jgi:elongation factor P